MIRIISFLVTFLNLMMSASLSLASSQSTTSVKDFEKECQINSHWRALLGVDKLYGRVTSLKWQYDNYIIIAGYMTPFTCETLPSSHTKIWRQQKVGHDLGMHLDVRVDWFNSFPVQFQEDSMFTLIVPATKFFSWEEIATIHESGFLRNKKIDFILWGDKKSLRSQLRSGSLKEDRWSYTTSVYVDFQNGDFKIQENSK